MENRKLFHIQAMLEKVAFPHRIDVRAAGFRGLEEALKSLDFLHVEFDGPQSRLGRVVRRMALKESEEGGAGGADVGMGVLAEGEGEPAETVGGAGPAAPGAVAGVRKHFDKARQ